MIDKGRRNPSGKSSIVLGDTPKNRKIPNYIETDQSVQHYYQGGGIQSPDWPDTVLQLPTVRPCLGELQATPSLLVWAGPPA
jgi:hypothetical protein